MSGLVEFLRARLDEDEAKAAPLARPVEKQGLVDWPAAIAALGPGWYGYLVRHRPDRILREVAAKRRIVDAHPIDDDLSEYARSCGVGLSFGCGVCHEWDGVVTGDGYCGTLRLLAAPYSDHPDYNPDWAPDVVR